MKQPNVHVDQSWSVLNKAVEALQPSKIFILIDQNIKAYCLPIFADQVDFTFEILSIISGEEYKTIQTCQSIWGALIDEAADRKSLFINLGGGVIGDMGGFCASVYKRGIPFIHIPTTLLAMVDASIGGKVGIDHVGLKNILGDFVQPELIFVHTNFLKSLDIRNIRSGFAEIIKHAIVADADLWEQIRVIRDVSEIQNWKKLVENNIKIKQGIVNTDPSEQNVRKTLNFGHTIGHALESHSIGTTHPLFHGEAVALGIMKECAIAVELGILDREITEQITKYIQLLFPDIECTAPISEVLEFIKNDKKNQNGEIQMALPSAIGSCQYNINVPVDLIRKVLLA